MFIPRKKEMKNFKMKAGIEISKTLKINTLHMGVFS
jgi:hypothetical protein